MVKLSELMSQNMVILGLEAQGVEDCLEKITSYLEKNETISHGVSQKLLQALLERENTISTGIGSGIAIPHAYIPEVDKTQILFARAGSPIPYKALDNEPVNLIFVVFGNESETGKHIRLIARISRLLRDQVFLSDLNSAQNPEDIEKAVVSVEARHF